DEIRIGHSVFMFLVNGQAPPRRPAAVELDDRELVSASTVALHRADAPNVSKILDRVAESIPASQLQFDAAPDARGPLRAAGATAAQPDHTAELFAAMVRACRAATSLHKLEELQRSLMDVIFDSILGGRAAILLVGAHGNDFASALH